MVYKQQNLCGILMRYEPFTSENTLSIRAIWLLISYGTGMTTKTYFDWLCRFCVETRIRSLQDLAFVKLHDVENFPAWQELTGDKKAIIAQYLSCNSAGKPNFIEYAEYRMIDLCRHQIGYNIPEQLNLMIEIEMNINSCRFGMVGPPTPLYTMPIVPWRKWATNAQCKVFNIMHTPK